MPRMLLLQRTSASGASGVGLAAGLGCAPVPAPTCKLLVSKSAEPYCCKCCFVWTVRSCDSVVGSGAAIHPAAQCHTNEREDENPAQVFTNGMDSCGESQLLLEILLILLLRPGHFLETTSDELYPLLTEFINYDVKRWISDGKTVKRMCIG